jgi:hypothetical protein
MQGCWKTQSQYQKSFAEWNVEHDAEGWRADVYLYCVYTTCLERLAYTACSFLAAPGEHAETNKYQK